MIFVALGSWNSRLPARRVGEEDVMGEHVFGRQQYLERRSNDRETLSRYSYVNMAKDSDLVIMNIKFEKAV